MFYTYKLTSPSGKSYVGFCSTEITSRWMTHRASWRRARQNGEKGTCPKLYSAFDRYDPYSGGWIVECVGQFETEQAALDCERETIASLNTVAEGYNLDPGGRRGRVGVALTPEHKAKISEWNSGKTLSDEHKAKISASNRGKKRSEEYKLSRSVTMLGHTMLPQTRKAIVEKISKEWLVHTPTEEVITVKNLKTFAKEQGLTYGCLRRSNSSKQHRGYWVELIE
jgi:hypothetical protein